jgi:hypothetical protein
MAEDHRDLSTKSTRKTTLEQTTMTTNREYGSVPFRAGIC